MYEIIQKLYCAGKKETPELGQAQADPVDAVTAYPQLVTVWPATSTHLGMALACAYTHILTPATAQHNPGPDTADTRQLLSCPSPVIGISRLNHHVAGPGLRCQDKCWWLSLFPLHSPD